MPYIVKSRREEIHSEDMIDLLEIRCGGDLNYAITIMIAHYFKNNPSYQSISDISGACTEALAEFRRRVVVPYEEQKIKENGDLH